MALAAVWATAAILLPQLLSTAAASDFYDREPILPVELRCPTPEFRSLLFTARAPTGYTVDIHIQYGEIDGEGDPVHLAIDIKDDGGIHRTEITMINDLSPEDEITAGKALKIIDPIMRRVCNGSDENKRKFERHLLGNRNRQSLY